MKLIISLKQALSNHAIKKVLSDIEYLRQSDCDYDELEILHISQVIMEALFVFTDIKINQFNICVGNQNLDKNIDEIHEWISDLPWTYDAIRNLEDFSWDFDSATNAKSLYFSYQEGFYLIQPFGVFFDKNNHLIVETISIDELKKEVDRARKIYCDYIEENFGSLLSDYLEMLELSFDD